jgi:hypothetical protein
MLNENLDAGGAAVSVGYESASQFSREYRRLFGHRLSTMSCACGSRLVSVPPTFVQPQPGRQRPWCCALVIHKHSRRQVTPPRVRPVRCDRQPVALEAAA